MATTNQQAKENRRINVSALSTELEVAALNARNLLHIANRELLEDIEIGISLVAAAERYVADVVSISERLSVASAQSGGEIEE